MTFSSRPLFLTVDPSVDFKNQLSSAFPAFKVKSVNYSQRKQSTHPKLFALRMAYEKHIYNSLTSQDSVIVDIGGNPLRHTKDRRHNVWCMAPVITMYDKFKLRRNTTLKNVCRCVFKGKMCSHARAFMQERNASHVHFMAVHSIYHLTKKLIHQTLLDNPESRFISVQHKIVGSHGKILDEARWFPGKGKTIVFDCEDSENYVNPKIDWLWNKTSWTPYWSTKCNSLSWKRFGPYIKEWKTEAFEFQLSDTANSSVTRPTVVPLHVPKLDSELLRSDEWLYFKSGGPWVLERDVDELRKLMLAYRPGLDSLNIAMVKARNMLDNRENLVEVTAAYIETLAVMSLRYGSQNRLMLYQRMNDSVIAKLALASDGGSVRETGYLERAKLSLEEYAANHVYLSTFVMCCAFMTLSFLAIGVDKSLELLVFPFPQLILVSGDYAHYCCYLVIIIIVGLGVRVLAEGKQKHHFQVKPGKIECIV